MRRTLVALCVLARFGAAPSLAGPPTQPAAPADTAYGHSHKNTGPANVQTFHSAYVDSNKKGNGVNNATKTTKTEKSTERSKEMNSNETSSEGVPTTSKNNATFSGVEEIPWKGRDASGELTLAANSVMKSYEPVFRPDDEDIRTDFKNSYDIWPFFYQNVYEYEPKKLDVDTEKAKDKRFAIPTSEKVIPVHEKIDETADGENSENKTKEQEQRRDYKRPSTATTDNPNYGNQPFFSYVLNDYFDKTDENDPNTFKELPWGSEFDHEMALQDIDDYAKRIRRLEENTPKVNKEENRRKSNTVMEHDATRETLHSKGRGSHRESDSREKGDHNDHSYDGRYQYDGENYRGFKDFADSFAHRFGLEDHDRVSNFDKKNNSDKSEKKKGFRKIYHKDEYQEHHDFFDNTDNSENIEEKGTSKVHIGGSEAFLRSLAGAATGSDENKLSNAENVKRKKFERNREDKQRHNRIEQDLDQYRDIAKHAALSNNADYVDRYTI